MRFTSIALAALLPLAACNITGAGDTTASPAATAGVTDALIAADVPFARVAADSVYGVGDIDQAQYRRRRSGVLHDLVPGGNVLVIPTCAVDDSWEGFPKGIKSESMTAFIGGRGHGFSDRLAKGF